MVLKLTPGSVTGALKSLPNESVKLGKNYNINFSEFLIFNDKLSSTDELKVEGYLAHKWGLQGELPSGHAHKSNTPSFAGWAIERGPSGVDDLTLNLSGAGDKFTKPVPMNDDLWHHLATTFGGGNKKIYIDGAEVGTTSQSGSITDSISRLILGDPNINSSSSYPKIDDVRFYRGILTADEVSAIYNNGSGDVGAPKFTVTSPSTIQAAKGKNLSYQITTDAAYGMSGYNSTITYSLLNKPEWLSVNSSDGAVSGIPTAAGTYTFQAKATNTLGTGIKDVTITVYDYSDWNYALPITSDYSGGSALEDWNMLVRLSEDSSNGAGNAGFRYSQARSNGGDLRFIDKSGSELKYEIAKWNPSGESQIWVNVPALKSDANISMYWGNPNAGLPAYANNGSVWDGYFGVYHLEGTTGSAVDSSPLSNNLPGVNAPVLESNGLAGAAYSSTNSVNNGFMSSAISSGIKPQEGTYSFWGKIPDGDAAWTDFWGLEYNSDSGTKLRLQPAATGGFPVVRFARTGQAEETVMWSSSTDIADGVWRYISVVIDDGETKIYVNGAAENGTEHWFFPGLDQISGIAVGRGISSGSPNLTFDEATFSTVGRSAAWLSASFHNQKPSSTYLNFGSLIGPISLDDPSGTEIYGKKDSNITSFTVGHSGSGSFSATGLPPGLSINSVTGVISGATSVVGSHKLHRHRHGHDHRWWHRNRVQSIHRGNQRPQLLPFPYGPDHCLKQR